MKTKPAEPVFMSDIVTVPSIGFQQAVDLLDGFITHGDDLASRKTRVYLMDYIGHWLTEVQSYENAAAEKP